jgi:drug/metabolite transporter (DMT)-like permease
MIFSLNPIAVLGILALAGEKLTGRHGVRLFLALSGVYLLIGPGGQTDWLGVLLAFANVCSFALEVVLIQWFLARYDTRTITVYVLAGMTVVMAGSWLVQGAEWQVPGWQGWLIVGIMALAGTFFGWWAMFSGLQRIGGGQVALLMPLETLLSVLWAVLFLQERLTLWQTLGGILILSSALLAIQRLKRAN